MVKTMDEIWKTMPRHPTHLVSNKGRVAKILVATAFNRKHPGINIGRRGNCQRVFVHRAMLEAFVSPPPYLKAVTRHLNDIPTDNRLDNLRWGTASENARDAIRNGRRGVNENAPRAKLSNKDIIVIRTYYDRGHSLAGIAAVFGVAKSHVCGIGKRRFWKGLPEDYIFDEVLTLTEELARESS